ncbi:hypothetical protein PoB_004945100 [Plakobranchus ocellatus]|uniref:Uncharacterized protein n=1 Tax=Plakobranchus ocellatus TaxID=259542 RepID=A0AAV4BHY5_9GAST|nr:hypothetical protein PoB_004945100 [Plakobranchus ocellatus]
MDDEGHGEDEEEEEDEDEDEEAMNRRRKTWTRTRRTKRWTRMKTKTRRRRKRGKRGGEEGKGGIGSSPQQSFLKCNFWFSFRIWPVQGDLRLSGLPSGEGACGGPRTPNRSVAADPGRTR